MKYVNFVKGPRTGLRFIVSESKPAKHIPDAQQPPQADGLMGSGLLFSTSQSGQAPPGPRLEFLAEPRDSEAAIARRSHAKRAQKTPRTIVSPPRRAQSRLAPAQQASKSEGKRRPPSKQTRLPSLWSERRAEANWLGGLTRLPAAH